MDEFVTKIMERIEKDLEGLKEKRYIDEYFAANLAQGWIKMNVATKDELELKFGALKAIVCCPDFKRAAELSAKAYQGKRGCPEGALAAELIAKIAAGEEYAENSRLSHYKLLDKYLLPETHNTDSFICHAREIGMMAAYLGLLLEQ